MNSLYFDSADFQSVRDNLAGLPDREKYRVRWYGDVSMPESADPRLEIKTRSGRLGGKHVFRLETLSQDYYSLTMPKVSAAVSDKLLEQANPDLGFAPALFPMLYVGYQRTYFQEPAGIRATLDRQVRYRPVLSGDSPENFCGAMSGTDVGNNNVIAELKFPVEEKSRVSSMLRHLHLVPQRHSKYLMGMAMSGVATYI